jgi:hypothetical protein
MPRFYQAPFTICPYKPPLDRRAILAKEIAALARDGLNQKQMADWLGVTPATIRRYAPLTK